ncbi:hypothetical protein BDV09DRAFT_143661 [Aspergillus tetrazonus]
MSVQPWSRKSGLGRTCDWLGWLGWLMADQVGWWRGVLLCACEQRTNPNRHEILPEVDPPSLCLASFMQVTKLRFSLTFPSPPWQIMHACPHNSFAATALLDPQTSASYWSGAKKISPSTRLRFIDKSIRRRYIDKNTNASAPPVLQALTQQRVPRQMLKCQRPFPDPWPPA